MRSLLTPMLLISLGIHGAFLLIPTSEEEKSPETNTEIAQAAEVEDQTFPTSEAKSKLEQESQEAKLSPSKEEKKAALPSPKPVAVANAQASVARRTQGQSRTTRTRTNTRATPQSQQRKSKSSKTNNSSNSRSSRPSQRNSSNRPSASNSASTPRESSSQSTSTVSSQQKNVPSNSTTANPTPAATPVTQRRVDNIPAFNQGNSARAVNSPTPTSVPVISSLAPSNASNSTPVTTVPTIVARTQNQDERVKNRLEFLKTFPRYPQAQWGLPEALQGEEVKEFFYRLQTRDGIEVVAKKFIDELLPQNKFTGELNTDEENWQVYQVSNGKHTQYLHLISQEGNTGIFLASEEFSREDLVK